MEHRPAKYHRLISGTSTASYILTRVPSVKAVGDSVGRNLASMSGMLGRTIGIHYATFAPCWAKRDREIYRNRRFTNAAFSA